MNDINGSWRPTIADNFIMSSPVTPASATIGIPSAPNATGAVLAISESTTARRGAKPSAISKNAATATGAPNPAVPSKSAPKQTAQQIELSGIHREVVQPQRREHDPHDRPQRVSSAVSRAPQRQVHRHVP